jgi:hypothetical protein
VIISHEQRFIFVKTRKTAGTSIEAFLAARLGAGDTVAGEGELSRNQRGRWNPLAELASHPDLHNARLTLNDCRAQRKYYAHLPAWRIRERIGRRVWEDYFTFCFERDPWDKLVAFYWWRTRHLPEDARPDFATFVRTTPRLSAWDQYTIDDEVAVDFVGQFENLEADMRQVLDRIGLDAPLDLPHKKGGYHQDGGTEFTPELDQWVAETFHHEIAEFGYRDRSLT